jgi:hypothetical protein
MNRTDHPKQWFMGVSTASYGAASTLQREVERRGDERTMFAAVRCGGE